MRLPAKSFGLLFLIGLFSTASVADPLHPFGQDGAWRHEFSGWLFPRTVSDFTRVQAPYTIDGNNDVGARYQNASGLAATVEVYLSDSAAADAKLNGAKSTAARAAGESSHMRSERPFRIKAHDDLSGTKVIYVAEKKSAGPQTSLYFFEADRWTVKVLVSAPGADSVKALDAFVRSLPWDTLGDPTALH